MRHQEKTEAKLVNFSLQNEEVCNSTEAPLLTKWRSLRFHCRANSDYSRGMHSIWRMVDWSALASQQIAVQITDRKNFVKRYLVDGWLDEIKSMFLGGRSRIRVNRCVKVVRRILAHFLQIM